MRKCFFSLSIAAVICVLLLAACKHDPDYGPHNDTDFLVGKWRSAGGNFTFKIEEDLSFECEILNPDMGIDEEAKISGSLDAEASGLAPNDYILRNLQIAGDPEEYPGNENPALVPGLFMMKDLHITLTPNEDLDRFTFIAPGNTLATNFFGNDGDFFKQP